jgi:hypothetical protein
MDEDDQLRFGFDVLDPTKIVPEEYVPVTRLGKMTLNRNPKNYFAETEQVMVSHIPSTPHKPTYLLCIPANNPPSSNPATLSEESTSVTTPSSKAAYSPTSTPN